MDQRRQYVIAFLRNDACCYTKMKEQTGNVYENKGSEWKSPAQSWNVYDNTGTYPNIAGMLQKTQAVSCCTREPSRACGNGRRPGQSGSMSFPALATTPANLQECRNKPGMLLKTKDRVKKPRVECWSTVGPQPGVLTPQLFDSRLLDFPKADNGRLTPDS
jgi:hypothetical protein